MSIGKTETSLVSALGEALNLELSQAATYSDSASLEMSQNSTFTEGSIATENAELRTVSLF